MNVPSSFEPQARIQVLLEEYRALYSLAKFRVVALDRRVPLASTTLSLSLGGAFVAPVAIQAVVLMGLPIAVLWLVRTTINHSRSFEDALRRIEQIELHVNAIAGETLLAFQSSHPSRGESVGGRTGRESVLAVALASTGSLVACLALAALLAQQDTALRLFYLLLPVSTSALIARELHRLDRYRYRARETESPGDR